MSSTPRFRPRNLLVTGGAGFIGANFVHFWLRRYTGGRIVILDALTYAGNRSSIEPLEDDVRLRFVHGDVCDEHLTGTLLRDEAIDTIVHFAAETHVDRSIHGPDDFLRTNVIGTHALLKAARMAWLEDPRTATRDHRFQHISTDEVYGSLDPSDPAFRETTAYAPNSPYSASKAAADHLVRAYHRTYGLNTVTSNCSNNYGPYQFPEKLIPLALVNLLHGNSIPIYGDGKNVRDWLFVEDHCRGIELCLLDGAPGETYNFGGNNERTNVEVVQLLCAAVDRLFASNPELTSRFPNAPASTGRPSNCLIEFVRDRPGHDRRYAVDASKAARELGYRPVESLESGIERTIAWYFENESWWSAVMNGSYRRWIAVNYTQ